MIKKFSKKNSAQNPENNLGRFRHTLGILDKYEEGEFFLFLYTILQPAPSTIILNCELSLKISSNISLYLIHEYS
jgi:hypothetical protein